jgi:hypothetical protein
MQLAFDFYNTIHEIKECAEKSRERLHNQQVIILDYFQCYPGNYYSPCDFVKIFPAWPLTSIRRAITNLTKEGRLIKTHKMKIGIYGKQVHTWRLA